ncbi:MAG TPA: response regulator [Flavisolibacter sp.]|nr:response regulator [Flavisolibacter sp.]
MEAYFIKHVFLADDDEDDRDVFRDVIYNIIPSAKVEVVNDGETLLHLLSHMIPDILFLDLEMPGKNGLQCLLAIRGNEKLKDIPIVVFSSTTRPANVQTAYDMGADLFLTKKSSFQEYTKCLETVLKMNWNDKAVIKKQFNKHGGLPFSYEMIEGLK